MNSLFIAYENDEWCHFVVRIGSPALILFYSVCFVSFSFFLFFSFFVSSVTCQSIEVSLTIIETKQWSCSQVPKRSSRDKLLQPYLVVNVIGLAQFGKNLSYILPPLASQNYLLQSISVKLIYQFLYLINGYLFFRCLEKVFEEERNENKKGNSRGVTTTQLP